MVEGRRRWLAGTVLRAVRENGVGMEGHGMSGEAFPGLLHSRDIRRIARNAERALASCKLREA